MTTTRPRPDDSSHSRYLDPRRYTVAWVAPLEIEARAALAVLDERHAGHFPTSRGDDYLYKAGRIAQHNIVIATFPASQEYGTNSAAALASQLKKSFPNLWFALLVGVAAGLPSPARDIRLGDILVALPSGESPAVIDYQLGKETAQDGFQLLRQGHILAPIPSLVGAAIASLRLDKQRNLADISQYYNIISRSDEEFMDPGLDRDVHYMQNEHGTQVAAVRPTRAQESRTKIWYGTIGSGNKLLKNSTARNALRDNYDLIGLEMEAAGMMNRIPTGVIRGVCDYGDEQKNKEWQPYAAAMAAAYAKTVLCEIQHDD
ncbi:purine and uridine phosphorylase, partial [Sarocladium strictum]